MVDDSSLGFDAGRFDLELHRRHVAVGHEALATELAEPTPVRMWAIAKAFEEGMGRSGLGRRALVRVAFDGFSMVFDDF